MYSPATALEAVTPIPVYASIIATGVVATVYTTLVGFRILNSIIISVIKAGAMH